MKELEVLATGLEILPEPSLSDRWIQLSEAQICRCSCLSLSVFIFCLVLSISLLASCFSVSVSFA